jgi:AmmeMemoRadiSam system protein A
MPSPETAATAAPPPLAAGERARLADLARRSIADAFEGRPTEVDFARLPARLAEPGAAFVTLERGGELRGCIGSVEARRPLAADVVDNARAAAFGDPRFPPLAPEELARLEIHISVLGQPRPLPASSEEELLAALRPGVDGLILEDGLRRATFLPAVWQSLPAPRDFLRQLKRKAGLAPDHWSGTIRFRRYEVEEIR